MSFFFKIFLSLHTWSYAEISQSASSEGLNSESQVVQKSPSLRAMAHYMRDVISPRIQRLSFQNDIEYCGYIVLVPPKRVSYVLTPGRRSSCGLGGVRSPMQRLAIYHTHGAHGYDAAQTPSVPDMQVTRSMGLPHFLTVPSGRMWYISGKTGNSRQLSCGRNQYKCVDSKPGVPFNPNIRLTMRYGDRGPFAPRSRKYITPTYANAGEAKRNLSCEACDSNKGVQ